LAYTDSNGGDAHNTVFTYADSSALPAWIDLTGTAITFTPTLVAEAGTYNLMIVVTDDDSVGSGSTESDTITFTLTVTVPVNDAPVITAIVD
jgi:hypothetical protein